MEEFFVFWILETLTTGSRKIRGILTVRLCLLTKNGRLIPAINRRRSRQRFPFKTKSLLDSDMPKNQQPTNRFNERSSYPTNKPPTKSVVVDLERLSTTISRFSNRSYFYYGFDAGKSASLHLIVKARKFFHVAVTKPIQWIKHRLDPVKDANNLRLINEDSSGRFIRIPKCNFDVELSIDAIRLSENYDTVCLFSGDNDFLALLRFLKEKRNKKVILVHDGHTRTELKAGADLTVSAQRIKKYIAIIKKTQRAQSGEGLDIGPVSTGRMPL